MSALARLDFRLDTTDKERISCAADLRGVPVSAFVREAARRAADQIIATEQAVQLSREESRRFLKAIDAPFRPNAKLAKTLARIHK